MVGNDRYTDTWGKSVLGRTGSRYRDPGRSVFGPFEGQKARQRGRNGVKPGESSKGGRQGLVMEDVVGSEKSLAFNLGTAETIGGPLSRRLEV